ncbi:GtrA family protein [uncultured Sphingomonas sp.]|uniref:GtrA family protein n=1 Tax=uncultured Sphingomonas sp. TaxID=158754 RepID=UPI0025F9564E|nr:GtrA family protein [uncultured Sphingomonas sp.]
MDKEWSGHGERQREAFWQLVRFGIAGGISTLIYSAVYLPLTAWVLPRAEAVWAVPPSFLVAVTCGFFLHSRWSFKGQGAHSSGPAQQLKFVGVQASGMALNALVTWIGTAHLGLAPWVPLLPAVALATIVTFLLNKYLVFV